MIMADCNVKVSTAKVGESSMGKFGFGERNKRGDKLIKFVETYGLKIAYTYFRKEKDVNGLGKAQTEKQRTELT